MALVPALAGAVPGAPAQTADPLPFPSKGTTQYNGKEAGVMHDACGNDNHVAILMGVAEVLTGMRDTLPGTVKCLFQPSE